MSAAITADAIKEIVNLAERGRQPVFTTEREPKHVYYLNKGDGDYVRVFGDPAPLTATVNSIVGMATLMAHEGDSNSAVWYSRTGIIGVLDHTIGRRKVVTMPLKPSPQMDAIKDLAARKAYSQRELILFLRTMFLDCLDRSGDIINVLRSIRFDLQDAGTSEAKHGKSSIGRQMRSEISGASELPEIITLAVPPFAGNILQRGQWVLVRMALEPSPETQSFQFFPLAGEMDIAWAAAEDELLSSLTTALEFQKAEPRIYHGQPN